MHAKPKPNAPAPSFDPIGFTLAKPLATPSEIAVAFGQLIDAIADLGGYKVQRTVTPTLSAMTISWRRTTIPSDEWLSGVEEQLLGFGACTGVHVYFRRH